MKSRRRQNIPIIEQNHPYLPDVDRQQIQRAIRRPVRTLNAKEKAYIRRHKVYVTLTSDPERVKYLPLMLSLLDTKHVHEIHVNLPRMYRNEIPYDAGDLMRLRRVDKVKVYRIPVDMGPITKVLPTLRRVDDKDALIISIDDDIVYPRGMINEHIHTAIAHPNDICTGSGFSFLDFKKTAKNDGFDVKNMYKWWPSAVPAEWPFADIAEGFGSICYKKRLVDIDLMAVLNGKSKHCKLSDDFTINYSLQANCVNRRIIANRYLSLDLIHPLTVGEEKGLHVQTPPGTYWDYNTYKYVECSTDIKGRPAL
jgi:hypothetical protein